MLNIFSTCIVQYVMGKFFIKSDLPWDVFEKRQIKNIDYFILSFVTGIVTKTKDLKNRLLFF